MAGWRPPDTIPLDELREARAALAGAGEFLAAEQGRPGRVDLAVLTGGNSLALQLLHDALGYRATNVRKRSARSAIATASSVLEEVSKGRDPTVERAVFRSLSQSNKTHSTQPSGAAGDQAEKQVASRAPVVDVSADAVSDRRRPAAQPRQSAGVSVRPSETTGTQVRRLTDAGIERAKEFLTYMREHPRANREPPRELLFGERYSRPFRKSVQIERRAFRTRRDAAQYFVPKFHSIRHLVTDHAGLWSWLGMYYFASTVRVESGEVQLSPLDETFVAQHGHDRPNQLKYQNYLWCAWRLYTTHGESVAFLLDQDLTSMTALTDRALRSVRAFRSVGVIPLMMRLYTAGGRQKRGVRDAPGGQRHLLRVLNQLERTYDVYGMSSDALVRVLPVEFQRWDSESAPRAPESAVKAEPAAAASEPSPASNLLANRGRGKAIKQQAKKRPPEENIANGDATKPTPSSESVSPSVRQTLLDIRAQIEQQGQVSWADPREHLKQGSEAWAAYVATCGVPERRLFRTAFLHRLDEVLASLE